MQVRDDDNLHNKAKYPDLINVFSWILLLNIEKIEKI